tara:strand:- start:3229 stop:3963 length:735 start_codon:yes stop_codon:yes gene_type:complete
MREWRNFDPDVDEDGTDPNPEGDVWGCSDPDADNYNPNVTIDNGTCDYGWVAGCTDHTALNYNPNANYDDGSCVDVIGGGDDPVYGCTNPTATNYNPLATVYDGSCEGEMFCDDVGAINYGDAGECEYLTDPECGNLCTDIGADNYNECADCIFPDSDVVDCLDPDALNMHSPLPCLYEDDETNPTPQPDICGCTDLSATNYNPLANETCNDECEFKGNWFEENKMLVLGGAGLLLVAVVMLKK